MTASDWEAARISRSQHNSRSFLSRLPAELVLSIFEFCVTDDDLPQPDNKGWYQQNWIAEISHVCSSWRSLAVAHPPLWTEILNFAHPPVAEVMIRRSGQRPLNVVINLPSLDGAPELERARVVFTQMWQVLRRTKVLMLLCSPLPSEWLRRPDEFPLGFGYPEFEGSAGFSEVIDMPSPILERFIAASNVPKLLDDHIFGRCSPSLQVISLIDCNFAWDRENLRPFSRLTTLSLREDPNSHPMADISGDLFHIRDIIPLLSTLPLLTLLELRFVLKLLTPEDDAWLLSHQSKTCLPKLRYLELDAPLIYCIALLDRLHFPSDVKLELRIVPDFLEDQITYYGAIIRDLSSRMECLSSPQILAIHISTGPVLQGPPFQSMTIYTGSNNGDCHDHSAHPFQMAVTINPENAHSLLQAFHLRYIELVEITAHSIEYSLWKALSILPDLSILHFIGVDWGYVHQMPGRTNTGYQVSMNFALLAGDHRNTFKSLETILFEQCLFPPSYSLSCSTGIIQHLLVGKYASNLPARGDDVTLDKYRFLAFLKGRKSNRRRSLQVYLIDCEELDKDDLDSFMKVANIIVE